MLAHLTTLTVYGGLSAMNIYTIYKATHKISGKCYIGYDSNWPKRQAEHKTAMKIGNHVFHRSLRKYGWDSFEWEAIYQSSDAIHTLKEMEPYFIREFNSCIYFPDSNGYNMTEGGEGTIGYKHTPETKIKLAEVGRMGKGKKKPPRTNEYRETMSRSKKGSTPWNKNKKTGQVPWNKGRTNVYSDETIAKMSESANTRDRGDFKWWNDGEQDYYVLDENVQPGWLKDRVFKKRNMKTKVCPHCGHVGSGGNMTRYHGDNCKQKTKEKGA